MNYIEELRDVIRRLHGAEPVHVESVAVKETFKGQTVWEGIVEVFDLIGHPTAHSSVIQVRFTADDTKGIAAAAKASNQTVSEWVRSTIHASLNA